MLLFFSFSKLSILTLKHVLKDLLTKSETQKMYKESDPIFLCTTPSTGQRLGEVVIGTLYWCIVYQRQLLLISALLMVLYTRNVGSDSLDISFSSRFWSIKSFKTSECESRIVGRSINFETCSKHQDFFWFPEIFPWCSICLFLLLFCHERLFAELWWPWHSTLTERKVEVTFVWCFHSLRQR